eukprot:701886-Pelagomonas_calceolata.AAC.1
MKSMGIRMVTSSSPCLILVTRIERSLLKSASGASKFIRVLDRMGMKLQSKPGGHFQSNADLYFSEHHVGTRRCILIECEWTYFHACFIEEENQQHVHLIEIKYYEDPRPG